MFRNNYGFPQRDVRRLCRAIGQRAKARMTILESRSSLSCLLQQLSSFFFSSFFFSPPHSTNPSSCWTFSINLVFIRSGTRRLLESTS